MAFKLKYGGGTANAGTPGTFSQSDTSAMQMLNNNGNGDTDPPKKRSLANPNAPSPYADEYRKGQNRIPRIVEKYGKNYTGILDDGDMVTASTDSRGIQSVMGEGNILEQRQKFEKQFGKGSSRTFNFATNEPSLADQDKYGGDYRKAQKKQQEIADAMYETSVEMANNYLKTGKRFSEIKPKGVAKMTFSPAITNIPSPGGPSTAVAKTSKKRKKKKVLKGVGRAIGSVGRGIGNVGEDVGDFVGDVGQGIGKGIRRLGYRLKGRGPRIKSRGLL